MGTRKGAKVNTKMKMNMNKNEDGEISTSTSSPSMEMSQGRTLTTNNKIGGEISSKKMKRGESSNSVLEIETASGQTKESSAKETSMKNFPPEMLTQILKSVDSLSLLKCRLVNCQWSEISSGILTTRSDATIKFKFDKEQFFQKSSNPDKQKTSLNDFLNCMKESSNPPFARFAFVCGSLPWSYDYSTYFSHEDFTRFLSAVDESKTNQKQNQNQKIKIKSLEFQFTRTNQSFKPLVENLRDLLHTKIPHLQEFGLYFGEIFNAPELKVELIPPILKNSVAPAQLVHLKVVRFKNSMIVEFPEFLKQLLISAVNLEKIYLYKGLYNFSTEIYDFLHPLGKFHLLKSYEFQMDNKFLSRVKERPDFTRALFKLQLEELKLDERCGDYNDLDSNKDEDNAVARATNFMSSLLESNKNSLKQLKMRSSEFLHHLQFPRFQNLTKLKIKETEDAQYLSFPRGVRSLDIFPAVRELVLPKWIWCDDFPHLDSLPIFPRVQNFSLHDPGFNADCVGILVLLCPNLKHLKTHRNTTLGCKMPPQINFLDVGRQIWTQMKGLQSLEMDIDVESEDNYSAALDSCFTGISTRNCQRLFNLREAKKTVENTEPQDNLPESEIELMAKREHASILDMKDLKTLKINPYSGTTLLKKSDFFTKLTWVSEEYAFKFLPHLKPKPKPEEDEDDSE